MAERILVSACLYGEAVRYDGQACTQQHPIWQEWQQQNRLISCCPEVAGGLPIPRFPAEWIKGDGHNALIGIPVRLLDNQGTDVYREFYKGAQHALQIAQRHNIKIAVLKSKSPSCGTDFIYDGTFTGTLVDGIGLTAAVLQQAGIQVFNELQLVEANTLLNQLDQSSLHELISDSAPPNAPQQFE